MTSEELRESVSRAVMGAMNNPPPMDPFVMDEELRAATADPGGHHGFVTGGEGGSAEMVESWKQGLYAINDNNTFINCYYSIAGRTYAGPIGILSVGINAIRINSSGEASLVTYDSVSALMSDQTDVEKYIIPLYTAAGDGDAIHVTCDWRLAPHPAVMAEFL